jgi:hypothetical protein
MMLPTSAGEGAGSAAAAFLGARRFAAGRVAFGSCVHAATSKRMGIAAQAVFIWRDEEKLV